MPVRNQDFFDLNESRPWPLSDEATGVDDDGKRLPSRFIADLHLSFPLSAGRRAMLSAVTITRKIATVTILATEKPSSTAGFVPLAAVSIAKPIDAHRMYPLEALFPGAGGWIVFGSTAADENDDAEEYSGRFLTPAQSILLPSTARAYESLPIVDMARLGNFTKLTGLVRLLGGSDIEIVKECREIPANLPPTGAPLCDPLLTRVREVIVIRLREDTSTDIEARNVFDIFKGPCGGRPESRSCGDPEPIEFITSVGPDCCGNINIRLRGCAKLTKITQEAVVEDDVVISSSAACGVIIDCNLGLTEACITPDRLPDADGNLPNQATDLCESETSITLPDVVVPPEESESISVDEESESSAAEESLPFCDGFEGDDPLLNSMELQAGYFAHDEPRGLLTSEGPLGAGQRNIATWVGGPFSTFYKRVSAQFVVHTGDTGQLRNAALVADFGRKTFQSAGEIQFYFIEMDFDDSTGRRFRIGVFDGNNYVTIASAPAPFINIGGIYNFCMSVFPFPLVDPTGVSIYAQLSDISDFPNNIQIQSGLIAINPPKTGKFGIMSNRSATWFTKFCVENTSGTKAIGCSGEPSPP